MNTDDMREDSIEQVARREIAYLRAEIERLRAENKTLRDIVMQVARSPKGSIGGIDTHYLAQISVASVRSALAEDAKEAT